MGTLQTLTGRPHLSYSSLTSWLDCGERFRLEKVLDAPQSPAWWFISGSAIHEASEALDLGQETDPAEAFLSRFHKAVEATLDEGWEFEQIRAGGRVSNLWPNKENFDFWVAEGPGMVANWVAWRDARFAEGWSFLDMDGRAAIEVKVDIEFPDVRVVGYIDRIMIDRWGQAVTVDLKSGSREPDSSLQLGVYGIGMQQNYGISVPLGTYFMARKGTNTEPASLMKYSHELVGSWFGMAKRAIESEVFIPKVGPFCNGCAVSKFCSIKGDPAALQDLSLPQL